MQSSDSVEDLSLLRELEAFTSIWGGDKSSPFRCPKCPAIKSYYGRLVAPKTSPGECPHCGTPLVPVSLRNLGRAA